MINTKSIFEINLSNKVALVTGASRGLGAYYAKLLSRNGAHVIVSGRESSRNKLEKIINEIHSEGNKASLMILNLNEVSTFKEKVKDLIKQHKHIDILVNNAAISSDKAFFDVDEHNWDIHLDTNLKGLFFLSQAVASYMVNQDGYKSIINIAAINGQRVRKNCLPFSASKAAVIHLTRAMAYELVQYKIKVNAISLGLFASEAVVNYLENDPNASQYLEMIPEKRAGEFIDLEGPLLLLASDASNYMSGSIVNVDGGFSSNVFMDLEVQHSNI